MALKLEEKQAIVAEVADIAKDAISAVAANYRGLTASEMNELRTKARESSVHLQVVKNTLAKRAFADTSFDCMNDALVGPLVLAFSKEEPGAAARLMKDFAKQHNLLDVKALSVDGKLLGANELDAVAALPTRDGALSMLLSVMQAPISKFVRTLAEPHTQLVRAVDAVRLAKEQAA